MLDQVAIRLYVEPMAGYIHEWFGFRSGDTSIEASEGAAAGQCPFVVGPCTKAGGVCSIRVAGTGEVVPVCPKRMYFNEYEVLARIASQVFHIDGLEVRPDGLPQLSRGDRVAQEALDAGYPRIGVFGGTFSSEIALPPAIDGGAKYRVDFTLVLVDEFGRLIEFVAVEVQSIDTTNNYRQGIDALRDGRREISTNVGLNWENVNKRILPQLIIKGLVLQGEENCAKGMFFVTPDAVYEKIMKRLGGPNRLRRIPMQPSSLSFVRRSYSSEPPKDGAPLVMEAAEIRTISVSDLSLAFISPENLPAAGSYGQSVMRKIRASA